ncbi:hypothetical protein ABZY58_11025 [Micromonospora tulbaghiae]|uniref:hypothetical protein n=1 Tax=Micromonospora tulbaghiae TaxID=479978 RepID=UPI0033A3FE57
MADSYPATNRDIARAAIRDAATQAWAEPDYGGQKILDNYADAVLNALTAAGRVAPADVSFVTITGNQRRMSALLVELTDVVTRTADLMDPARPTPEPQP